MKTRNNQTIAWAATFMAVGVVAAFAFSAADTGARTVSATVVGDSAAYVGLQANGLSPHKDFVTQDADGKLSVSFGSGVASGTGVNPDASYTFAALVNVTNQGTESKAFDVTISGADAALCQVALTATTTQADSAFSADPDALTLSVGAKGYLGLKISSAAKTTGQSVACAIAVTAS